MELGIAAQCSKNKEIYPMKKILSLALGMTFMLGMVAFAQDTTAPSTDQSTSGKKMKKHKKSKKDKSGDKMSGDSTAPKQ